MAKTTIWLDIVPVMTPKTSYSKQKVKGSRVRSVYYKDPHVDSQCKPKGIVVEVQVDIPDEAFLPYKPKVEVQVVPHDGSDAPITVVADVHKGRAPSAAAKVVK